MLEVAAGASASISGVTMADGRATGTPQNPCFRAGGIIRNYGTLTLDRVRVTGGIATSGGGIANTGGMVTIERSLIDGNDGGVDGDAGGILNFGGGTMIVRTLDDRQQRRELRRRRSYSWADPGPGRTSRASTTSRSSATAPAARIGGIAHDADARGRDPDAFAR